MNLQDIHETSTHSKVFLYLKHLYLSYYIVIYSDQKMHLGKQCGGVENENSLFAL